MRKGRQPTDPTCPANRGEASTLDGWEYALRVDRGRIEYWSTPMLKGRLVELLDGMGFRPFGKNPKLTDLAQWVMHDLPAGARSDPRAEEAIEIARCWWQHERSSK